MSLSMEQYSRDAAEDTLSVINANKLKEIPKSFPGLLENAVWSRMSGAARNGDSD